MKKITLALMAVVVSCMFLTGCGASTPTGSDSNVKKLVLEIATDELRNQLAPMIYQKITGIPVGIIGAKITYTGLRAKAAQDAHAKKSVVAIDDVVAKAKMSISNIRTNEVNDKTKMSRSSADLIVNKSKFPIEYTAQINADGELYVEVFGLRF